ncbi:unnamed protein product, partial [Mesorhabditis belari]|uniref:C2 domain-containing protein n=1 Tax=Mesorhabditis belari TaxID=2138241 RepID=A0AAF3J2J5_9BILA
MMSGIEYLDDRVISSDSDDERGIRGEEGEFFESLPPSPPMARLKSLHHHLRYGRDCEEDDLLSSSEDEESYDKENQLTHRIATRKQLYQKAQPRCKPFSHRFSRSQSASSLKLDMDYSSSITGSFGDMTGEITNTSQDTSSLPDTDSLSEQYAPIRRQRLAPPLHSFHPSRISPPTSRLMAGPRLSSIEELPSPHNIYPDINGDEGLPSPMPRFKSAPKMPRSFRPLFTSTTTSFQPMAPPLPPKPMLPKTNPNFTPRAHHNYQFQSSTPKQSKTRRVPRIGKYSDVLFRSENSFLIDPVPCDFPVQPLPIEKIYDPTDFGYPSTMLAKNAKINGILFLKMTITGNILKVRIQNAHFFFDPPLFISSFVRLELVSSSRAESGRKRSVNQRRADSSVRTHRVLASRNPRYDQKFAFELREIRHSRLHITVYITNIDRNHKDFYGGMTFPIKKLFEKAADRNGGRIPGPRNRIDINNGGFYMFSDEKARRTNWPQENIRTHKEYGADVIDGPFLSMRHQGMLSDDWRSSSAGGSSWVPSFESGPTTSFPSSYPGDNRAMSSSGSSHLGIDQLVSYDYTSASSSVSGVSGHDFKAGLCAKFPNYSVPSFTFSDVTSETDSNLTGADGDQNGAQVNFGRLHAPPDTLPPQPPNNNNNKDKQKSGGLNSAIRRAQSFTFSPKQSVEKNNQRLPNLRDEDNKKEKKFFGPLQKTVSYLRNKLDGAMSTGQLYPSREEVRQWETDFEALITHKFGCALFRDYLKKELSDENIDFWVECEEFKRMKEGKKETQKKAQEIFNTYVKDQAPREVNLDSATKAATKAAFEGGCGPDAFSLAQSRIQQLMEKDSYRRFLKDIMFTDLLNGAIENGSSDK